MYRITVTENWIKPRHTEDQNLHTRLIQRCTLSVDNFCIALQNNGCRETGEYILRWLLFFKYFVEIRCRRGFKYKIKEETLRSWRHLNVVNKNQTTHVRRVDVDPLIPVQSIIELAAIQQKSARLVRHNKVERRSLTWVILRGTRGDRFSCLYSVEKDRNGGALSRTVYQRKRWAKIGV